MHADTVKTITIQLILAQLDAIATLPVIAQQKACGKILNTNCRTDWVSEFEPHTMTAPRAGQIIHPYQFDFALEDSGSMEPLAGAISVKNSQILKLKISRQSDSAPNGVRILLAVQNGVWETSH